MLKKEVNRLVSEGTKRITPSKQSMEEIKKDQEDNPEFNSKSKISNSREKEELSVKQNEG